MRKCSDDCDQRHCSKCGSHTVGNVLIAGMCQDCYDQKEQAYNIMREMQYREELQKADELRKKK